MPRRSIEETFQVIRPRGWSGIPEAPTIGIGVSGTGDLAGALSQAGQQIAQLQQAYQNQSNLITANTQALQSNTSVRGGGSGGSTAANLASSFLGGSFGLLSPIISGIAGLFGGGHSAPPPLPVYIPPAPVSIDGALYSAPRNAAVAPGPATAATQAAPITSQSSAPAITVNVHAMDSQSFMDRSVDIANAVREAMLNLHPINDVVSSL